MKLKEEIQKRLEERRKSQIPRREAFDGNSGLTLELDGRPYYRDLQGRYYEAVNRSGVFFEGAIEQNTDLWHRLEGLPEVLDEKRRLAEHYNRRAASNKRAPQPMRPFLP